MKKRLVEVLIGMILAMCCFLFTPLAVGKDLDLDYPTTPINFIIPFGAGGTTDLTYRAFISAASKYLGQPIIPINKPGAGGTIAAMAVMTANQMGIRLEVAPDPLLSLHPFPPILHIRILMDSPLL